jgi:Holliday junction resolvasome RuvABC endonuclease subunit
VKVLGVDPGIRGGLAVVRLFESGPRLIDAIDVPVVRTGAKERVDVIALQQWLSEHDPYRAFIERAQAMPKQGASSGFKFGRATGAIEAAIAASAIPLEIIEPSMWKRALRLRGKDKEGARQYALQLFPHAHHLLRRKLDHQRAEAALIGYVGIYHLMLAKPEPARPELAAAMPGVTNIVVTGEGAP